MNEQVPTIYGAPLFNSLSREFVAILYRCLSLSIAVYQWLRVGITMVRME